MTVKVYICDMCDHVEETRHERINCTMCGHKVTKAGWFEYAHNPNVEVEEGGTDGSKKKS